MNQQNNFLTEISAEFDSMPRLVARRPFAFPVPSQDIEDFVNRQLRTHCFGTFCPIDRLNGLVYKWTHVYVDSISSSVRENVHLRTLSWTIIRYSNIRACPHVMYEFVINTVRAYKGFYSLIVLMDKVEMLFSPIPDRFLHDVFTFYNYLYPKRKLERIAAVNHVNNVFIPSHLDEIILSYIFGDNVNTFDIFTHLRLSQKFNLTLLKSAYSPKKMQLQSGTRFKDFMDENKVLSQHMKELHNLNQKFNLDPRWIKNSEAMCLCIYQILRSRNV